MRKPPVVRREPELRRMHITEADLSRGMQRALELALSECAVSFMNIVTTNQGKLPAGHMVRFSVDLVPRD